MSLLVSVVLSFQKLLSTLHVDFGLQVKMSSSTAMEMLRTCLGGQDMGDGNGRDTTWAIGLGNVKCGLESAGRAFWREMRNRWPNQDGGGL